MKRWIQFSKYQGTGNDFVLIDNRLNNFPKDNQLLVARLCDRKFGVGADGLILIENHDTEDFSMVYYNADGAESTMCGNGGRCLVAFAKQLNIINHSGSFMAVDGIHHAVIEEDQVKLQMKDVSEVQVVHGAYFLDTGSPHHVALVDAVLDVNVPEVGASIRYGQYGAQGANINFVTPNKDGSFFVRTYERGVEDETLSCGTGVTAVAIAMHYAHKTEQTAINVQTPGGDLQVSFEQSALGYEKIFLTGGAVHVFDGSIWIDD
ncbi:MAG: diaminopimelate epimerase [Flavobacteriaceae bacterium]